ncbi:MAG: helix-turn-helix domain-containing protein [Actinomycetota bacterium]|nr:helix-turn-helix domain-containing protein [Actinomycetota bacterium]
MTRSLSDVVAERVRRSRREIGWTVAELAEECRRLGAPSLTVASLGNIERGDRGVRKRREITVDEVFVLAYALGVPPLLMMVPLGENDHLRVTSTATIHPHLAWDVATGRAPLALTGNYATRVEENFRYRVVVQLFDTLRATQEAYTGAAHRLRIEQEVGGTQEDIQSARDKLDAALGPFAHAVENLMRHGQAVPPYRPETVAALRRSGILTTPDRLEIFESTAEGGDRG